MHATRSVDMNLAQPDVSGLGAIDPLVPASRQRRHEKCLVISFRRYATDYQWRNANPALKGRAKFIPTLRVALEFCAMVKEQI